MKKKLFISQLAEWRSFVDSDIEKSTQKFPASVYSNITTQSNKYDIYITILLLSLQIIPYYNLIKDFWNWDGSVYFEHSGHSWGLYHHALDSWLITYDGGFIRRGLIGELIKLFELITNFLPHIIVAMVSILSFVILVIWTIRICGNKIPIYFIFSPVFFAISARWDVLFSTDFFMLLFFLGTLTVIVSNYNKILTFLLINFYCTFAILTKEIYIFSCLPILMLIYNLFNHNKIISFKCIPIFIIPIATGIAVTLHTYTDPDSVLKTSEYWNDIYKQKISEFCCFEKGYFNYFKDSWINGHLPQLKSNWGIMLLGFIWLPIYWLFVWYFCGIFTAKVISHYDAGREKNYLALYYFSTLFSLPMWVLAMDWGRWILIASITSFLAAYLLPKSIQIPKFVEIVQIRLWKGPLRFWQKVLIVTCFGVPGFVADFSWVYYAAPIWYPMQFIISTH